ncbi:MAG: hypothetical protein QOD10_3631, partial [Mycobacterium sp.]|nr:hypothetical protein [Mycobacterium sp.]
MSPDISCFRATQKAERLRAGNQWR